MSYMIDDLAKAILAQFDYVAPDGTRESYGAAWRENNWICVDVGNGSGATAVIDLDDVAKRMQDWWGKL